MVMVLTIILFLILVCLLYYGYSVVTDTKLIPDWVYFWKTKKSDTVGDTGIKLPSPDTTALGYCDFEGEDLFSGDVYTFDGKKVPIDVSPILCSTCNQYVYKNNEGCVSYIFDKLENTNIDDTGLLDKLCDPKHPERNDTCIQPHGTCTPSMAPSKKCQF